MIFCNKFTQCFPEIKKNCSLASALLQYDLLIQASMERYYSHVVFEIPAGILAVQFCAPASQLSVTINCKPPLLPIKPPVAFLY